MTAPAIRTIDDVQTNASVERSVTFTERTVAGFAELVADHAPVHFDDRFARGAGFSGRIVHGFLLGSIFSGMLGEQLPGPYTVITTMSLKLHRPALVGETLQYRVTADQVSPAVGAVVLSLQAKNAAGDVVLSGKAICNFPHRDDAL